MFSRLRMKSRKINLWVHMSLKWLSGKHDLYNTFIFYNTHIRILKQRNTLWTINESSHTFITYMFDFFFHTKRWKNWRVSSLFKKTYQSTQVKEHIAKSKELIKLDWKGFNRSKNITTFISKETYKGFKLKLKNTHELCSFIILISFLSKINLCNFHWVK